MKNKNYKKKQTREKEYYTKKRKKGIFSKILHLPFFYDTISQKYNYDYIKIQMYRFLHNKFNGKKLNKILIAPCGTGDDSKYLLRFAKKIYGIDISPVVIQKCSNSIDAKVGDILNSGYPDESFDLIECVAFFHHYVNFSFDPFLKEFYRILKPGGSIIILEPCVFYPMFAITRPIKKIFKNPFGEVEDEAPIRPINLIKSLKRTEFINLKYMAASFSHVSFFIQIAKIINKITFPLLNKWPFKLFGWYTLFWAEKK